MIKTFEGFPPLAPALNELFRKSGPTKVAWSVTGVNSLVTGMALQVEVNGLVLSIPAGTSITTPNVPVAGTDYAIWCQPDARLIATADFVAAPVTGARLLGWYHYAPGGNAPAQSGGDSTPAINPYSCFDLHFRPKSADARGMTLVAGHFCADIYLTNTAPDVNGTSRFGATIANGSSPPKIPAKLGGNGSTDYGSLTWFEAASLFGCYGKRLPTYAEFMLLAFGVTEATSFGSNPPNAACDAPRTSRWGVMQATGNLMVWGLGRGGPYGTADWVANTEGFGATYSAPSAALLGGGGDNAEASGSRCSAWNHSAAASTGYIGARGVCDLLILG